MHFLSHTQIASNIVQISNFGQWFMFLIVFYLSFYTET